MVISDPRQEADVIQIRDIIAGSGWAPPDGAEDEAHDDDEIVQVLLPISIVEQARARVTWGSEWCDARVTRREAERVEAILLDQPEASGVARDGDLIAAVLDADGDWVWSRTLRRGGWNPTD
jgi:hypothetical protein